jgi:hypothetical protein
MAVTIDDHDSENLHDEQGEMSGIPAPAWRFVSLTQSPDAPIAQWTAQPQNANRGGNLRLRRRPAKLGIQSPQTSRATSTTSLSFAICWSMDMAMPSMPLAKPHCGDSAS